MKLHYNKFGENGSVIIILHGLFGYSDNWQTHARDLAENYQVYTVDQRNHGRSPHSIEFNYDLMVEDLHELVQDLGIDSFHLIGHSMGGKTAIGFAAEYEEMLDSLIVVDISHKQYPRHHDEILNGLNSLDVKSFKSRGEADKALAPYISNLSVRQFLLKNLYWIEKGKLDWRMNLPVLSHELDKIIEEVYFRTIDTKTLFIRGTESNYITESDFDQIALKFPNSDILSIEGAGHWVHAEAPSIFIKAVKDFLSKV